MQSERIDYTRTMAFTDAISEPVLVPTLFLAPDLEVLSQQKRESVSTKTGVRPAAANNEACLPPNRYRRGAAVY